ncbi:Ig-like domain-containing protein, partial [Tritonibacter mobilis]|uniref:Ig-like domain-containing protein n=1 Tax=Tritonibacter mobilis TaxID=379347 RepID=UPI001C98BDB2
TTGGTNLGGIAGAYGQLVLNADGTYSYTPTAGMSVPAGSTDVFTYTVIDADGDTATAELTITFSGDAFAPSATNQTTSLSDVPGDDSVDGSHADGFAPQSDTGDLAFDFGGDGPGGFVSAVYDGALGAEVTNSSAGGVTTITTDYWTLEINETTGAYTFTQTAAYPHAPGTATDQGSVAVTIEDSDGSTAVATITLN